MLLWTALPHQKTLPVVAGTCPTIARSSVVLPAPFPPTNATERPHETLNVTPRSAQTGP